MSDDFTDLVPDDVRMLSFQGTQITVILRDQRELIFKFDSEEKLRRALELWSKIPPDRREWAWPREK